MFCVRFHYQSGGSFVNNALQCWWQPDQTSIPQRPACLLLNHISVHFESKALQENIINPITLYRFEDLRIRRVKKEGRKKNTTVEKTAPKDGRSDKVASLLFTAILDTEQGELIQSTQSRPISLSEYSKQKTSEVR